MEGEGDHETLPPAEEESALELEYLPNEMLYSILKKLVIFDPEQLSSFSQEHWDSNFLSAVAYRRVFSSWRDFVDEILERSLLSRMRTWFPQHDTRDLVPSSLASVNFKGLECGLETETLCPPSLMGYNGSNPFPAKALKWKAGLNMNEDEGGGLHAPTIRMIDLFSKMGHHLSVLSIGSIVFPDLADLVTVLEACVNLKVLVLGVDYRMCKDTSTRPLPDLQQLRTLLIASAFELPGGSDRMLTSRQWLVEPYAKQLIQFEDYWPAPITAPLPKLKQLNLSHPNLAVLQHNGPAVSLQRLCVVIDEEFLEQPWDGDIYDMFEYLDQFSLTLVDLFLNVSWSHLTLEATDVEGEEEANKIQKQLRRDVLMNELERIYGRLPTFNVRFSRLKTLAFPYPEMKMHGLIVKQTVLPKFPRLEELQFLHFGYISDHRRHHRRAREIIRRFLERENYWAICPNLKRINVMNSVNIESPYFSCTRPVVI